jgi:hypothetical protein
MEKSPFLNLKTLTLVFVEEKGFYT